MWFHYSLRCHDEISSVSFHNALCSADGGGYFSEFGYQASRPMPARRKPTPRTACIRLATKLFPSGLLLAKAPSALANIKAYIPNPENAPAPMSLHGRQSSADGDGRGAEGFGAVVSADDGGGAITIG